MNISLLTTIASTREKNDPWNHILAETPFVLHWLAQQNWPRHSRIGVCSANNSAFAALLQAAFLHNMTLVLINHRLSIDEQTACIQQAQLHACISDHPLGLDIPLLHWPQLTSDTAISDWQQYQRHAEPEDIALVLYTSGSRAAAKAVRLSHRALVHASSTACAHNQLHTDDIYLCCLPLDHIGGASIIYRSAIAGFSIILCDIFDSSAINAAIEKYAISAMSLVPTMLHRLLQQRQQQPWPKSLTFILIGGAHLPAADRQHCRDLGCSPSSSYGMSEFASQICTQIRDSVQCDNTAMPLAGIDIRCDQQQRISIRSTSAFSGYEINGDITTHHATDYFTSDDIGCIHNDGSLEVFGRTDDTIICGGENVSLITCSELLQQHPNIHDVICLGIDDPDWGQICVALIACRPHHQADIKKWILHNIHGIHNAKKIIYVKELSYLASGKNDRQRALEIVSKQLGTP